MKKKKYYYGIPTLIGVLAGIVAWAFFTFIGDSSFGVACFGIGIFIGILWDLIGLKNRKIILVD